MTLTEVFKNKPSIVRAGIRKGRAPDDGYRRGWGLQYGDIQSLIEQDDLFQKCISLPTIQPFLDHSKKCNLFLLLSQYVPLLEDKNVVEFGSFKGGTAIFMSLILREICPEAKVFALDTFEGMPTTDKDVDAHNAGDFSEANLDELRKEISRLNLTNLIPMKGFFQDTFPSISHVKFGLAHLDADIYSSIKYAQDAVWPSMTRGGYIVYDDATISSCIGATEAVEELIMERKVHSEQIWPHFVFRSGL